MTKVKAKCKYSKVAHHLLQKDNIILDQHNVVEVVMFVPYTSQHSANSVADKVIAYPMSITN